MRKYCQLKDHGDGAGLLRCINPIDVPDNIADPIAWLAIVMPGYEGFRQADPSVLSGATALPDADLTDPAQFTNPVEPGMEAPSAPEPEVLP